MSETDEEPNQGAGLSDAKASQAFDDWFYEVEGFGLRAERFDGDVDWLKAAFAAGLRAASLPTPSPQ